MKFAIIVDKGVTPTPVLLVEASDEPNALEIATDHEHKKNPNWVKTKPIYRPDWHLQPHRVHGWRQHLLNADQEVMVSLCITVLEII